MLTSRTARTLHLFAVAIGCLAALLGAVDLVGGWGFGIDALKGMLTGLSTQKANTALCITALGASLALTGAGQNYRVAARAAAGLALIVGLLTLAEYAFNADIGIDELLFRDTATRRAAFPGRPAIGTALMISLLAVAQLSGLSALGGRRPASIAARTATASTASLIAWATLNGYVFGPEALQEEPMFSSVALHTAIAMLLLATGILAAAPSSWPVRTVFANGTSGTVCRWLLPPAILAPPVLGWLISPAGDAGVYPDAFRWALYSTVSSLGAAGLILLLAHRIALIDAERTVATEMSLRDPLTGLANRRAFDAFLLESFNLATRHKQALSLALLDVDRFKSYNDEYGHPAGDELLKSMGILLSSLARETDLVARVGGEEFAIALPQTDLAGARVIAERVRAEVERSPHFERTVTVSVGVAGVTDGIADISTLIETCDRALYRAKSAGRNRVFVPGELAGARAN